MSIYSGNNQSPFSGGKGKQLAGGGGKKRKSRAKITRRNQARLSNRVVRTGTSTAGKAVTFGLGNSGTGLIRNANSQALTTNSGFAAYDGFGIVAGGGARVLFLTCACGTDFASAAVAFAGKKKIKPTLTIDGVDYVGILDTGSFSGRGYKVVFPQLTSLFSPSAGTSTGFKIEFTT